MFNENDYKQMIADALFEKDLINVNIYEKCSKPHITALPYDLRTNDTAKLTERVDAINEKITELNLEIQARREAEDRDVESLQKHMETFQPLKEKYDNVKVEYDEQVDKTKSSLNNFNKYSSEILPLLKPVLDDFDYDFSELLLNTTLKNDDVISFEYNRMYSRMPGGIKNRLMKIYDALANVPDVDENILNALQDFREEYDKFVDSANNMSKATGDLESYRREFESIDNHRVSMINSQMRFRNMIDDYSNELKRINDKLGQ